jgi:hypothetical protein
MTMGWWAEFQYYLIKKEEKADFSAFWKLVSRVN